MDKSIDEWKRRFRGMESAQLENAWQVKAADDVSWVEDCNFHAAVADRLKQLGHMAIDLDEKTRLKLCRRANDILAQLEKHLRDAPSKQENIAQWTADADAYYSKYGSKTARYYMYEQGVIDRLGDRLRA